MEAIEIFKSWTIFDDWSKEFIETLLQRALQLTGIRYTYLIQTLKYINNHREDLALIDKFFKIGNKEVIIDPTDGLHVGLRANRKKTEIYIRKYSCGIQVRD